VPRPLIQHAHALPNSQPDARPLLGGALKDTPHLVEACRRRATAQSAARLDSISRPCRTCGGRRRAGRRSPRRTNQPLLVDRRRRAGNGGGHRPYCLGPQCSSASRRAADAAGFLTLSQWSTRPDRHGDPRRFDVCPRSRARGMSSAQADDLAGLVRSEPRRPGADCVDDEAWRQVAVVFLHHAGVGVAKILGYHQERHTGHDRERCPGVAQDVERDPRRAPSYLAA
jgi:hypothetical protein